MNVDVDYYVKTLLTFTCSTPIHLAVCNGHTRIVKLLLEHKCDVNARDLVWLSSKYSENVGSKNHV